MNQIITVVSGLPRSGTSMMMKMLQAGGMELLVDDIRTADEDNPKGYFEYEKVKRLHKDSSWIGDARGKTLKVISLQLFQLPSRYQYRVVFMQRTLEEIIQSQNAMLKRLGRKAAAEDQETRILFAKHLAKVTSWLAQKKNICTCRISFNGMFTDPEREMDRLTSFFNHELDNGKMLQIVDQALYRKRC